MQHAHGFCADYWPFRQTASRIVSGLWIEHIQY